MYNISLPRADRFDRAASLEVRPCSSLHHYNSVVSSFSGHQLEITSLLSFLLFCVVIKVMWQLRFSNNVEVLSKCFVIAAHRKVIVNVKCCRPGNSIMTIYSEHQDDWGWCFSNGVRLVVSYKNIACISLCLTSTLHLFFQRQLPGLRYLLRSSQL